MNLFSKRILPVAMAFLILIGALTFVVSGAGATDTHTVSTVDELNNALSEIGASGTGTIVLGADLSNVSGITIGNDQKVTLLGNGHTISFASKTCLSVSGNAVLNLGESGNPASTLDLTRADSNDDPGVLSLSGSAKVNMYDGITIRDAKNSHYFGGGVTIGGQTSTRNYATFNMYGGTIKNCGVDGGSISFGGGVSVFNGGTFVMNGGTIDNCYATTSTPYNIYSGSKFNTSSLIYTGGGGVFAGGGGTFIMNGGTIKNCYSPFIGGGVAVLEARNGTQGVWDARFEMNGGTIENCSTDYLGGGVGVAGIRIDCSAICAANPDGDPVTDPGITITGGTITGCTAGEMGGGIFMYFNRPGSNPANTISNTVITNNTADAGAGIHLHTMHCPAEISNCTVSDNVAKGVKSNYLLNNTTIDRYDVVPGSGGGILLTEMDADIQLKDGVITGNSSTAIGAGVKYRADYKNASYLVISGKPVIQDNTFNGALNNLNIDTKYDGDVHPVKVGILEDGAMIGLSDPKLWDDGLADEDMTAVSENFLTSDYNTKNPSYPNNDPKQYFTSDHETWVPAYGEKKDPVVETTTTADWSNAAWTSRSSIKYVSSLRLPNGQMNSAYRDLRYNPTTNEICLPSEKSGTYPLAYITYSGAPCLTLAYQVTTTNYRVICDLPGTTANSRTTTIPTALNRSAALQEALDTTGQAATLGSGSISSSIRYGSYVYDSVTTTSNVVTDPGYDYSSEVHLVRAYTVEYDPNGAGGTMADANSPYLPGSNVTVLENGFTHTNSYYKFLGWNTKPDGSGDSYKPDDIIKSISEDITLYAQWQAGFVLTKDFVIKDGYDGAGTSVPDVKDMITSDPVFTIEKLISFHRVSGKAPLADIPAFAEDSYTIPVRSGVNSITIALPDFTAYEVGDYWYTVTEHPLLGVAGFGEDEINPRYLHIQVVWDDEVHKSSVVIANISLHKTAPNEDGTYLNGDDDKTTGFINTFGAGSLTVTKKVSGNMTDPYKLFKVTVTLSAPAGKSVMNTVSYSGGFADESGLSALNGTIAPNWNGSKSVIVYLRDESTVTFSNIPDGVVYTVTEADVADEWYVAEYEILNGETGEDKVLTDSVSGKISDAVDDIIITNVKEVALDVGVILQNTPFVILLIGGIVVLIVLLVFNRRNKDDDDDM